MLEAINSRHVDKLYISTDDEEIMCIGRERGADIIIRPLHLAPKEALGEGAYVHHGYEVISEKVKAENSKKKIRIIFCVEYKTSAIII